MANDHLDNASPEDKLKKLRELHSDWDPGSLQELDDIERMMSDAVMRSEYGNMAMTQRVMQVAKANAIAIARKLSSDESLPTDDRKALFREKRVWLWFVVMFSKDYSRELRSIDDDLTNLLKIHGPGK